MRSRFALAFPHTTPEPRSADRAGARGGCAAERPPRRGERDPESPCAERADRDRGLGRTRQTASSVRLAGRVVKAEEARRGAGSATAAARAASVIQLAVSSVCRARRGLDRPPRTRRARGERRARRARSRSGGPAIHARTMRAAAQRAEARGEVAQLVQCGTPRSARGTAAAAAPRNASAPSGAVRSQPSIASGTSATGAREHDRAGGTARPHCPGTRSRRAPSRAPRVRR